MSGIYVVDTMLDPFGPRARGPTYWAMSARQHGPSGPLWAKKKRKKETDFKTRDLVTIVQILFCLIVTQLHITNSLD